MLGSEVSRELLLYSVQGKEILISKDLAERFKGPSILLFDEYQNLSSRSREDGVWGLSLASIQCWRFGTTAPTSWPPPHASTNWPGAALPLCIQLISCMNVEVRLCSPTPYVWSLTYLIWHITGYRKVNYELWVFFLWSLSRVWFPGMLCGVVLRTGVTNVHRATA